MQQRWPALRRLSTIILRRDARQSHTSFAGQVLSLSLTSEVMSSKEIAAEVDGLLSLLTLLSPEGALIGSAG